MKANTKILLIMLCAIIGFTVTFYVINTNIIAHPQIPQLVKIYDGGSSYNIKVIPMDSLKNRSVGTGGTLTNSINKEHILFQQNPFFLVWMMLILIMAAITSGAFPFFIWQNSDLSRLFGLNLKQNLLSLLWAMLIIGFMVLFINATKPHFYTADVIIKNFDILLKNGCLIIQWIIKGIFLLLVPALSLMFRVGYSSDGLIPITPDSIAIEAATKRINSLSAVLFSSLQYLAIIVVLTIFTTNALGSSIKSVIRFDGFDMFPQEAIYMYGLFFTLFLCIMYIPIYLLLQYKRKMLLETLDRFQDENITVNRDWVAGISNSLNEKNTALDNIKMTLTVLAPLITSFLPGQLQLFK